MENKQNSIIQNTASNNSENQNQDIQKAVQQYQDNIDFQAQIKEQDKSQQSQTREIFVQIQSKKIMKPVAMFKDLMTLKKQNVQKKNTIIQLTLQNKKLRQQYQQSVNANKKIQIFLKQIESAFKCDQFSRKANQVVNETKKTLFREVKQSQNSMKKIIKSPSANQIQEYKIYIAGLYTEKKRLQTLITKALEQNKIKRKNQDHNLQHLLKFQKAWQFIKEIINHQILKSIQKRNTCQKEKLIVANSIKVKQIQTKKQQKQKIIGQIKQFLLKKEGLSYECEILKRKKKQKTKIEQNIIQIQNMTLKKQTNIARLEKQLKQKKKTLNYMTKCSQKLKDQLSQTRTAHNTNKRLYELKIRQISKQFQELSRKYRVELLEEKKVRNIKQTTQIVSKDSLHSSIRKVRIVKYEQIRFASRKIALFILNTSIELKQFIQTKILKKIGFITLKQIKQNIKQLKILTNNEEIEKISRYIVQDNTDNYSKIDLSSKVEVSLAEIILKNLFKTQLKYSEIQTFKEEAKKVFNTHYDSIRQQLFLISAKSEYFDIELLIKILQKRVRDERQSIKIAEVLQMIILNIFEQVVHLSFKSFDRACQELLGRKLIKEKKLLQNIN